MIGTRHRFHGHSSLGFVYRRGAVVRTPQLTLRFIRNPKRSTYRLAVIVSRKVYKSAVARNRVRRRLYEIIRAHEGRIAESYDIVVTVVSDDVMAMAVDRLASQVLDMLSKAHIFDTTMSPPPDHHRDIVKT